MNFLFYSRFVYLDRGNFAKFADADERAGFGVEPQETEQEVDQREFREAVDFRHYTRDARNAPERLAFFDPRELRGTTRLQRENPGLFVEANEVLGRAKNGTRDEHFDALNWVLSRQHELGFDYPDYAEKVQAIFDRKEGLTNIDKSPFGRDVEDPLAAQRKMLLVARQIQRELETVQCDFDDPNGKVQSHSPYVRDRYEHGADGKLSRRAFLDPKLVADRFRQVDLHDSVLAQGFANRVQNFGGANGDLLDSVRGFIEQSAVRASEPFNAYSPEALRAGSVRTIAKMRREASRAVADQIPSFGRANDVMGQYAEQTANTARAVMSRGDVRTPVVAPVVAPVPASVPAAATMVSEETSKPKPGFWSRMGSGVKNMATTAASAVSAVTNTASSLLTKAKSTAGSWLARAKNAFRGSEESASS